MPVFHREKAIELAARLLWLAGTSVSAFRLLLLLYLAERAFLLRYAERFTGSSAEALPNGPMLTDVAALFSGEASPAADGFARGPHGLRLATTCKPSFDHLSAADIERLTASGHNSGNSLKQNSKFCFRTGFARSGNQA